MAVNDERIIKRRFQQAMTQHQQMAAVLRSLQQALIKAEHWSEGEISAEALASQQPFCMDTMNFSQWLQCVFMPNMQTLIDTQQALPSLVKGQGLEPMASEFYKDTECHRMILAIVSQIDALLERD